jgi:hypothetical protein
MRTIIQLAHNGDPYGRGFVASQSTDNGRTWFYRGDIGAMSKRYWRRYCQVNGYVLREREA